MRLFPRFGLPALAFLGLLVSAFGQTPRVYLKFDGNTVDSSGANVISAVNPNAGFVPAYGADRFGVDGKAIIFTGSQSLQLVASSMVNSNEALGLRNASGTNTSFTLSAWVFLPTLSALQGYNTVFGNLGSGGGTLHTGLGTGVGSFNKAHFGFDGNDANGATTLMVVNQWFHLGFVYDAA